MRKLTKYTIDSYDEEVSQEVWDSIYTADNKEFSVATKNHKCYILDKDGYILDINIDDIRLPMPMADCGLVWIFDSLHWNFLRCCGSDNYENFTGVHYYKSNFKRFESFVVDKKGSFEPYYFNFGILGSRYVLIQPINFMGNLKKEKLQPANYEGNAFYYRQQKLVNEDYFFDINNCEKFDEVERFDSYILKVRRGNLWGLLYYSEYGNENDGVVFIEPRYYSISVLLDKIDTFILLTEKKFNHNLESKYGLLTLDDEKTGCIWDSIYVKNSLILAKKDGRLYAVNPFDFSTVMISAVEFSNTENPDCPSSYIICERNYWWGYLNIETGVFKPMYHLSYNPASDHDTIFSNDAFIGNITAFWTGSCWGFYDEYGNFKTEKLLCDKDFFHNDLTLLDKFPINKRKEISGDISISNINNHFSLKISGISHLPSPDFSYTILRCQEIVSEGVIEFEELLNFTIDLQQKVSDGEYILRLEGCFAEGIYKKFDIRFVIDGDWAIFLELLPENNSSSDDNIELPF